MTRPIRILFHVDSLVIGGLEHKVLQLVLRLDRKRFEPIVSWSWRYGICGEQLQMAGVPVVKIVPFAANCPGVGEATRQIREIAPDIFHTFSCRENASDVVVAHRARVPIIISGRDNVRHWAPRSPARDWEFDRNAKTDFITPCCEAAAELCRKLEGVHPRKLITIYNGVEIPPLFQGTSVRQDLGLSDDVLLLGYAAGYRKLKGHETLLYALRSVVDRRPDVHLVCCGDDEEGRLEQLTKLSSSLSLDKHVTLLAPFSNMARFYSALDLYLHPSHSEALSMSILEAMSYRLPVVATSVGGTSEAVLDGTTGLLSPPSQPAPLSEAILSIIDRPDVRIAMGTAGRKLVEEKFSLDRMVEAFQKLYLRTALARDEDPRESVRRFTGVSDSPELADTTIFVSTIGDTANFEDCLAHLAAQTVRCRIEIIDSVAPMSHAFALMHELCSTPYYVQVDEDMLLHPNAIETLHGLLVNTPPDVAFACAPLWDCDVERAILGVKIYRHEIVKQFPYRNNLSCEIEQMKRIYAAGYKTLVQSTGEGAICLGEHGKHYSPRTIFRRWQRLFHKHNQLGHLTWLEPWPARLLERYMTTRDPVHLYAILGAIAGIGGRAESNRELDWRDANPALQRIEYYFRNHREPSK